MFTYRIFPWLTCTSDLLRTLGLERIKWELDFSFFIGKMGFRSLGLEITKKGNLGSSKLGN